jgi:hypothetical protein
MEEWENIPFDQEITPQGKVVNSPATVVSTDLPNFRANRVGNDDFVHRRLEMEMDQAILQNYDNYCHISMPHRMKPSPQMKALGKLEFRRAFLILSYLGRLIYFSFSFFLLLFDPTSDALG